ncbi:MAG: fasciclin domain-containing protein [Bacteroidaceae bacterium]|nr:fasciclin domain-containing protein [Bacteroidaceae bacterium]
MRKRQQTKRSKGLLYISMILFAGMFQTSCLDEIVPGNYYTFTGETIADYLENRDSIFSDYIYCLKSAGRWGEMSSYGDYTCFAPTNSSFQKVFDEWGVENIEALAAKIDDLRAAGLYPDLKNDLLDTIALTHLCSHTFYCSDLIDGALPYPNMLDRYLVYTTGELYDISEAGDTIGRDVAYFINKSSRIVQRDDTVQNGVVHIMTDIVSPSNNNLADQVAIDENLNIFSMILKETAMEVVLSDAYLDPTYPTLSTDSTVVGDRNPTYSTGMESNQKGIFPDKRKILYTLFAVPDSIMVEEINTALGAAYTEEDIISNPQYVYEYAKGVYDESYPDDTYNANDYTDRKNPLNRFISYHILPEGMSYNKFNISEELITTGYVSWDSIDLEDFYETLMPHSIMRISTAKTTSEPEKYINRKGTKKAGTLTHEGVKIYKPTDSDVQQDALNGEYHYIEKPLLYSRDVREGALNTRMRIMCQSLSPDFINSGARGRLVEDTTSKDAYTYGFLDGYCTNFEMTESTDMWVRYKNHYFSNFLGEEITLMNQYDVTIQLPPVPFTSTYEIRLYMCTMADSDTGNDRGVIQVYFGEAKEDGTYDQHPCGIPVDLTIPLTDPRIGGFPDNELGDEDKIIANDKAMRNRGYMKAMQSYTTNQGNGDNLRRDRNDCFRKILTTEYMEHNKTYKMRIRLVGGENGVCPFNCIEIVPKSVYANPYQLEDRL